MTVDPKKVKSPKNLERYFKGVANHRRIQILQFIAGQPDSTLWQIRTDMDLNEKTASEHVRRLTLAGLVEKAYRGREVMHKLTPYGRVFNDFIRKFSNASE